jgi:subtilisin-like proprotein convertase family protein
MKVINNWSRGAFLAFVLVIFSQALYATSQLQQFFEGVYSDSESINTADCQVCHATSTSQLNSYGKTLCDQLTDETNSTERLLSFVSRAAATEGLDSDGDGFSNIEEVNNSTQPGWTSGNLNPTYYKAFNSNECFTTSSFEEAPSWVQSGGLDPLPEGNLAPVAVNDNSSTPSEVSVTIDVLANDIDVNGDEIEISAINAGAGAHGIVDNNITDITYTPEADFCGTAIFQYQVTDGILPSNMASVTISVGDAAAPLVTAPLSDLQLSIPAGSSQLPASSTDIANWLATASAFDLADGNLTVNVNAPASFPAGTTQVVFSAIDSCGNTSTATADVIIIVDSNNDPVVAAPVTDPLLLTAPLCAVSLPSADPTIANWLQQATAFDLEDGTLSVSNGAPANFLIGNTAVLFSATDSLGASGSDTAMISVTATENSAPVLDLPSPISIEVSANTTSLPSSDIDIQDFLSAASATDNEDGTLTVTHDAPAEFPLGATTVTFQATDDCGLLVTSQATVTIFTDLTNNTPSITGPAQVDLVTALCTSSLAITDSSISAFFSGASALDDEDGDLTSSITHDAPASIPVTPSTGALTIVTFSVTDSGDPADTPMTATTTSRIILIDPNAGPTLVAPIAITTATPNVSVPAIDPVITSFLAAGIGQDAEDGSLSYSNNAPAIFEPGTTTVTFTAVDSCGLQAIRTSTVTVPIDNTAPVITLLGDNPMNIGQFASFSEPGAEALDDFDGDVTANIIVSGSVNTSVIGTYTLSYDVSDASGNSADTITRVVNVTDSTAPIITLLGNSPIEVELGSSFSDPGATASDNIDGDITGKILVSGVINIDAVGTYTLSYDVTDASGNAAVTAIRTVFVIPPDITAPSITLLGDNPISLEQNIAFNDPGATANDNKDGNISGNITVIGTVDFLTVGVYILSYNVSDAAGNAAVTVTRTVNVTPRTDITAPIVTLLGSNSIDIEQNSLFNDPGATASDNVDGNITANISVSGSVDISIVGSYNLYYNVSDAGGNAAVTATRVVNVLPPPDIIAPVITLLGDSPLSIEQNTPFSDQGATANDNRDGNISANVIASGNVNTAVIGSYTQSYNVSDAAGNAAVTVTRTVYVTVPADTAAPVISLLGANPLNIVQNITFTDPGATASDNVDGNISPNIVVSGNVNTAVIGNYTRTYNVSDAAGNAAVTVNRIVNVTAPGDATAPVISLLGANPLNIVQNITFTDPGATASDNVDGNISPNIVAIGNVNTAVIGNYTRTYSVSDAAGNAAVTVTRIVNVTAPEDATAPVISVLGSSPFTIEQNSTFNDPGASANDNVDGNVSANIVASGIVNTAVVGSYTRTYSVSDAAGNAAETVIRTVNVQPNIAPIITLSGNNPLEIYVGGTYSEPGYSATDNVDGNITANVSVNASLVNTSNVGSYSVTYNVSDNAGNAATTVIRTVNVVSTTSDYTANPGLNVGAASVSTTLFVADDRQIADLDVFINMPHAYPGDVSIILTSPAGTSVTIVDDPGKPASQWGCSNDDFLVTLDDEGSGNVEDACTSSPAISGVLIPNNALSAFDGESSQGTWTLQLDDSYTQADTGTLNSWRLIITAELVATPDVIAPVITLLGDNPMEIPVGGAYSELGYSAEDNVDGNITNAVSVNASAINTNASGSYLVTYSVADVAGNIATITRWVNVTAGPDTTLPVITLTGNNPLDVTLGSTYSDPGYSAMDNVDGDITASVLVNASAVNMNSVGSYVVTYNVSDAVGNAATTITRAVNIIIEVDTTRPVITLLGANPIEILEGGTYSEPGYSASDNIDGNITANVSVNASSVNTSVVGSYSVSYNVSDIAGNVATTVTRTVNVASTSSTHTANPALNVGAASVSTTLTIIDDRQIADLNVFIDMSHAYPGDVSIILTSPSGTSVTIVDDPGKPASQWGCANDDFLVTLDDEGAGNVEDACTSPPAISGSLIPNNALSAFDGESSQGTWTLQLDDSYTQADTGTLNSWRLIIDAEVVVTPGPIEDTTAPVLNLVGNPVIDLQNGVTFTDPGATAIDNVDGNITANISVSGIVNVNTDGTYILTYNVQDSAGNAATTVSRTVNVLSAPVIFAEAETGTIGGNHNIGSNHLGYTGSGFVDYVDEGYMEYTFNGSAIPYDLTIRYALGGGNRPLEVILNDATLGTIIFPATGKWTTWLTTAPFVITPNSGINTLRLQTTGSSGANVDSFTLTPQ